MNLIKSNFHEERDSINAYLVFDSVESAQNAITENQTTLGNTKNHIRVDLAGNKVSFKDININEF